MFRVIVAGGRGFNDYPFLKRKLNVILKNQTNIQIVSGNAPGADKLGEKYAQEMGYDLALFPAAWEDFTAPGAFKRYRKDGTAYNPKAGHDRNEKMSKNADALVAFWDKRSTGTEDMIKLATSKGLLVRVVYY